MLIPPSLKISEVVPMGAIVIRTRFDEGTESAEVATSGFKNKYGIYYEIVKCHHKEFIKHSTDQTTHIDSTDIKWRIHMEFIMKF
jgi:hypothetical protein